MQKYDELESFNHSRKKKKKIVLTRMQGDRKKIGEIFHQVIF